jgi:hypothetical protein
MDFTHPDDLERDVGLFTELAEARRRSYSEVHGQLDVAGAERFASTVEEIYQKHGKVDWFIDLRQGGKAPSSNTRKILAQGMASRVSEC